MPVCQYGVTELLDSCVLVVGAGLFPVKSSHGVSCFQSLLHNPATSYAWVSSHYTEEKMEARDRCEPIPRSSPAPTTRLPARTLLTLDSGAFQRELRELEDQLWVFCAP